MALSTEITAQLKQYLAKLNSNVVIEAFVDESEVSTNMSELLVELAEMTEKITLNIHKDRAERTPSFRINKPNKTTGIQFAGIPLGHEFSSLVLALLQVGEHPLKISEGLVCLLYTSDAADDSLRVDLGGRRIIKKDAAIVVSAA